MRVKVTADRRYESQDTYGTSEDLTGFFHVEFYFETIWAQTQKVNSVSRDYQNAHELRVPSISLCIADGQGGMTVAR